MCSYLMCTRNDSLLVQLANHITLDPIKYLSSNKVANRDYSIAIVGLFASSPDHEVIYR